MKVCECVGCERELTGIKRKFCDDSCKGRARTQRRLRAGCWVYHVYSEDGLIYVGRTIDPQRRMYAHKSQSEWWDQATRLSWRHFPSEADASTFEGRAIRIDQPVFNMRGSILESEGIT